MSVGRRIARRRRELGFNQTELAQQAGLRPAAISQYESGERRPNYEALIKLAGALRVSTDYLIGSAGSQDILTGDPLVRVLLRILEGLPEAKREELLDFALYLLNHGEKRLELPVFQEAAEYAEGLLERTGLKTLPVEVEGIAARLGIRVLEAGGLDSEGILYKEGNGGVILLDKAAGNANRRRFTLAHLLGHYVIPWHLKSSFHCRRYGTSTLKTEDPLEMEANNFAAALLLPEAHLERDVLNQDLALDELETLAHERYQVSLYALVNRLVDLSRNRAVVNSRAGVLEKTFQGNRPLVTKLHPDSLAAGFFKNPPEAKTTRRGRVPAACWFADAAPGETVLEESMYNPELGTVLTLLTAAPKPTP